MPSVCSYFTLSCDFKKTKKAYVDDECKVPLNCGLIPGNLTMAEVAVNSHFALNSTSTKIGRTFEFCEMLGWGNFEGSALQAFCGNMAAEMVRDVKMWLWRCSQEPLKQILPLYTCTETHALDTLQVASLNHLEYFLASRNRKS